MKHIELRSDTMTQLTNEMRESILTSPYGDWKYGQDQTVKELEAYAAQLFGVEDSAYVPSATFGNQCALLTAGKPGQQFIVRDESHMVSHENGSPGRLARLLVKTISIPFGYMTPEHLKKHFRKKKDSQAPQTGILGLEYPSFQGVIPPMEVIHECGKMAIAEGLHVHMDAARVFTALVQTKHEPKDLMKYCHSLTICLSKGLLAPIGSIVVGSKQFMARYKDNRKLMGGVLRKPGVVAGAALIALKKMRLEVRKDNEIARTLATRMESLGWIEIVRKI